MIVSAPRLGPRIGKPGITLNRVLLVGLGAAFVTSAAYVGVRGNPFASGKGTPTYQAVAVSQGPLQVSVNATGPVVNPTSVPLSFKNPGKLAELDVATGDRVVAGQVLARLDVADLQVQLEQSQATRSQQDANEAKVANGATPEQITEADAQVQSA